MKALIFSLAGVLAMTSLAHAQKQQHIKDATTAAGGLRRFDDTVDVNVRVATVSRGIESARKCLASINAAVKAGASMKENISGHRRLPFISSDAGSYVTNLKLVHEYCVKQNARVQLARAYLAMNGAFQQQNRIERIKSVYDIKYARAKQRSCVAQVARALKMKVSPATAMQRPEVTLGQAQAKVCGALATSLAAATGRVVAKAGLSGFARELKGARLRVLKENLLYDGDTFGSDKFPLKDPEDFANTDVWYEVYAGTNELLEPSWTVRVYTFRKEALVSTDVKHGDGEAPPKKLFK